MDAITTAEVVRPILLVECDFDTAPLYLWNGVGNLSYDSKTYVGAGNLLSVGGISESTDLVANGTTVSLTGVNNQLAAIARDEDYQGRELVIKLGAMDESGDVIADPVPLFNGFMDVMSINEGGEYSTITVSVENRLIRFDMPKQGRYTDQDQKMRYPDDRGLDMVSSIQQLDIVWGRPGGNNTGGSGYGGAGTGHRGAGGLDRY